MVSNELQIAKCCAVCKHKPKNVAKTQGIFICPKIKAATSNFMTCEKYYKPDSAKIIKRFSGLKSGMKKYVGVEIKL